MAHLPVIRTAGNKFVEESGKNFKYVGVSDFALFKRWLMPSGPAALVTPRLLEWKTVARLGGYTRPIVLRIFRYAAPPNRFALDPWSYPMSEVTKFTNFLGDNGFYVDWTAGDNQFVLPDPNGPRGQQQHINEFMNALVPCSNAFLQSCNEPFKNGMDVTKVIPPKFGTTLRSSGAYGDFYQDPHAFDPILDFIDFHSNRFGGGLYWPKWVNDLPVSAAALLGEYRVPMVFGEPMGADEVDRPGSRSNNPEYFGRLGSLIGWTTGVTFHSQEGVTGDHLGPVQTNCAIRFFDGVQGTLA